MSRFEGEIKASAEARLSVSDLLALAGGAAADSDAERSRAIACYLSAGDGWKDAVRRLGGAFAADCEARRSGEGEGE